MGSDVIKDVLPEQNEVVDDFFSDDTRPIDNRQQSGVVALTRAIRQSVAFFIIATILLILGFVLIINRHNVSSQITAEVTQADEFEIKVGQMLVASKQFELTASAEDLVEHNKLLDEAQKILKSLIDNPSMTNEDKAFMERTQKNLSIYSSLFNRAEAGYMERGINARSGINKELREQGMALTDLVSDIENPNIRLSLSNLRSAAKDFIILQDAKYAQPINDAADKFVDVIRDDDSLPLTTQASLIEKVKGYDDGFKSYVKLTVDARNALSDSAIAANATVLPLPEFREGLQVKLNEISSQFIYILAVLGVVLIAIFLLVVYQLRRAQRGADQTFAEIKDAQQKAEQENEQLNDSVINILEAVSSLSQKDLTARAPVTEDVIGTVSDSINLLADETATVLGEVTGIANKVSLVSDTVSHQASQVSDTAAKERESVQDMIETLFDATQTMNQVAALAEQSNESAERATAVTNNALSTVSETVVGMESIRETISEAEKRIKRLGDRSQEISGIVNLINTISERTHVLALNASMQAAVAGEAGRGFAVVAQEVQQLAESSRNATEQIATLVNNIQIETNETINTVNRTIGQVVTGSEQAQKAGEQMRSTQEITAELVSSVQNIAKASEEQKNTSVHLLEAVQAIGDSTEKTAEQISAQSVGTDELQRAAKELVESVGVFTLPKKQ